MNTRDISTRALGHIGEEAAALYLTGHGYTVLARNLYIGHAEIDLLAENDSCFVFVEVKTRRQAADTKTAYGTPASAVDAKKQAVLLSAADRYLAEHPTDKIPRIDVVEVYVSPTEDTFTVTEVRHFENAVRRTSRFARETGRKKRYYDETD
ncbi:MAG: YraN family protein [Clostridia bacterium]|nr:YraN family protein [Clostridia bacterium]